MPKAHDSPDVEMKILLAMTIEIVLTIYDFQSNFIDDEYKDWTPHLWWVTVTEKRSKK